MAISPSTGKEPDILDPGSSFGRFNVSYALHILLFPKGK